MSIICFEIVLYLNIIFILDSNKTVHFSSYLSSTDKTVRVKLILNMTIHRI